MNVAGIDPGMTGALAVLDQQGFVSVEDLPIHRVVSGKTLKSHLDAATLRQMLLASDIGHLVIERVASRPAQSAPSTFNFGYGAGTIYGLVMGLMIPVSFVTPQKWQKHAGCGPQPDAARQRASQLYPSAASHLTRKRDAGRADAMLIAHWGLCAFAAQTAQLPPVLAAAE